VRGINSKENGTPSEAKFQIASMIFVACKKQREVLDSQYIRNFCPPFSG
jgi:hypothetical protein